jgi:hypothetical protein
MHRIFILSPAKTSGKRASLVLNPRAEFALAARLRTGAGAPIGEVFSFLSGLYFRGKLAYARRFARPPARLEGGYVITSDAGLVSVDSAVTARLLDDFSRVPIDPADARYTEPLRRTTETVRTLIRRDTEVVLLGSIATGKYVDPLLECFGPRLVFPTDFIGRGDMSRGGLMLRAVAAEEELEYRPIVEVACRSGKRPPKLPSPCPLPKGEGSKRRK